MNAWYIVVADDRGRQPNRSPKLGRIEAEHYACGWMAENTGRTVWLGGPYGTQREALAADANHIKHWRRPFQHRQAA